MLWYYGNLGACHDTPTFGGGIRFEASITNKTREFAYVSKE